MSEDLRRRLDAVERAVTDGDRAVADLADAADLTDRLDGVESETEALERRVAELEASVRALRGYVGRDDATTHGDEAVAPDARTADAPATDETFDWDWYRADEDGSAGEASARARRPNGTDVSDATDHQHRPDGRPQPGTRGTRSPDHPADATDRTNRRSDRPRVTGRSSRTTAADRRGTDTDPAWPDEMDVDRAQPWGVPDPPTRVEDEERGLLDRLREAL